MIYFPKCTIYASCSALSARRGMTGNQRVSRRGSALTILGLPVETTDTEEGLLQPKNHSMLPAFNKKQSSASKHPSRSQIPKPPISKRHHDFQRAPPYPRTATPVPSSGCALDWKTTTDDDWWYFIPPFPFSPLLFPSACLRWATRDCAPRPSRNQESPSPTANSLAESSAEAWQSY